MKFLSKLKDFAHKHRLFITVIFVSLLCVLGGWFISSTKPYSPSFSSSIYSTHFPTIQKRTISLNNDSDDDDNAGFIEQPIDHFNSSNNRTYKQRFWYNNKYYNRNSVHFLHIGGEWTESFDTIDSTYRPIVAWAKKLGANLWNLEHRYYGKSRPTEDLSVENLKYLSSRQALEDVVSFIKTKNKNFGLKNPKWVVFGGSYAGRLALWFRDKYPELVVGAVGSSAPLELVVDYPGYYQTVQNIYHNFHPNCSNAFRNAFQRIDNLLKTHKGREELSVLLDLDPSLPKYHKLSKREMDTLFSYFSGRITTQYTTLNRIKNVCDAMMDEEEMEPTTRLMNAIKANGETPEIYFNYTASVDPYKNVSFDSPGSKSRAWTWQMCTEQGGFVSFTRNSIFGRNWPYSFVLGQCKDIFGEEFDENFVQKNVKEAIKFYGPAEEFNATNVVLTNGNLDPWSSTGIHKSKNPSMITIMIEGVSHCRDIVLLADETDPIDLKFAQNVIFENLQKWTNVSKTVT